MNHPEQVLIKAREPLRAGERVFYCQFDPSILFTASENVTKDLQEVLFVSVYTDGSAYGMIHPSVLEKFNSDTQITDGYTYKDFIEIDKYDPAVWE
jgi:hypothetical protein